MTTILQLATYISSVQSTIDFLRDQNVLATNYVCCTVRCSVVTDMSISDNQIFQCNICKKRHSIRTGSMWFKSRLQLRTLLCILYFFAQNNSVTQCVKFVKVSKQTVIDWYNFYRDICTQWLNTNVPTFNGQNVQIDETSTGGKRKYHRGRVPKTTWLFGIVQPDQHKCFLKLVQKRDHATLIPIIRQHIAQGSTIRSDEAQVYKCLG